MHKYLGYLGLCDIYCDLTLKLSNYASIVGTFRYFLNENEFFVLCILPCAVKVAKVWCICRVHFNSTWFTLIRNGERLFLSY